MTSPAAATDSARPARLTGIALIGCAIASLALLANHPGGAAHTFADVLKEEAANQFQDALVHGGFIAVLSIELVCLAIFSARLGFRRVAAVAGLVFFAMGVGALTASMLTDGLVIPAIAAKYAALPAAKLDAAKSLFVLCTTYIRFLMPMGLMFQGASVFAWGWSLLSSGASRSVGLLGLIFGALVVSSVGATGMNPAILMGAIAALSIWLATVGILLATAKV